LDFSKIKLTDFVYLLYSIKTDSFLNIDWILDFTNDVNQIGHFKS